MDSLELHSTMWNVAGRGVSPWKRGHIRLRESERERLLPVSREKEELDWP
jgi:hypothetical protein